MKSILNQTVLKQINKNQLTHKIKKEVVDQQHQLKIEMNFKIYLVQFILMLLKIIFQYLRMLIY